jgi:glutamate racemase
VIGVSRPGAEAAVHKTRQNRIGVIATAATVHSGAYAKEVRRLRRGSRVISKACPLLVPLVEEGWGNNRLTRDIIRHYLRPILREKADTLILGCTHYPLLKSAIRAVTGRRLHLVDSAENCAAAVRRFLRAKGLQARRKRGGRLELFVTDRPDSFSRSAKIFLGGKAPMARLVKL